MDIGQKKNFLINTAFALVILAVCYLLYKYIFPIVVPFLCGFLVAAVIVKISKIIKLEGKWMRIGLIVLFYGVFGLLITVMIIKGIALVKNLVDLIPGLYEKQIIPTFELFYKEILFLVNELDPSVYSTIEQLWESLFEYLRSLVSVISKITVNIVSGTAITIPSLFLSTLMMIITSFFFVADYENIIDFYHRNTPSNWKDRINDIRTYLVETIFVVLRSYILIMLLTFSELSVLFVVFGIPNPFLMAAIIAVFDIMPVLGSGGILLPWAIAALFIGNYWLMVKLVAIYGIITVVRHYVEPRIVGGQLGLHPIISLISMFIGLNLFGVIGMFAFPVGISFFWKNYQNSCDQSANSLHQ